MNFFLRLYQSLPVIKQLIGIRQSLAAMPQHFRLMETAAVMQALAALKAGDARYRDSKAAAGAWRPVHWSQNYEDGMIAEIFRRIGATQKTFLEIGVGDGSENNTTALLSAGWNGWWIDGSRECCESITSRLKNHAGSDVALETAASLCFGGKN